eukprot:3980196-Pyramimonas_sp.AAC.1
MITSPIMRDYCSIAGSVIPRKSRAGSLFLLETAPIQKKSRAPVQRKTEGSLGRERWFCRGGGFRRRGGTPP